jgi:rhodanese-related sulfurtransferase
VGRGTQCYSGRLPSAPVTAETAADAQISLSPERVAELLDRGEVQVIDVRAEAEWEAGHIPGATHIELDQVPAHTDAIEKGEPVVFQCRGGSRSELVASAFRESGWDAHNMEGGLRAWSERGLPLEPEGGQVLESDALPGR